MIPTNCEKCDCGFAQLYNALAEARSDEMRANTVRILELMNDLTEAMSLLSRALAVGVPEPFAKDIVRFMKNARTDW